VENQKLDAVISMPSGVFKPYAGVSTAFLLFTKTNSGGTDHVWFYDMQADGFSLDDKRSPQPGKSDLPDILKRWKSVAAVYDRRTNSAGKSATGKSATVADRRYNEYDRARTDQSFLVPKAEIVANGYDLSLNRYKEVVHETVDHDSPKKILTRLAKLEDEITKGRKELEGLLK
jgi:type I restriction enzyme M protein